MGNNVINHGPFQDDINYSGLIKAQSERNAGIVPVPKKVGKSKTKIKTKLVNRKIGKK